MSFLSWNFSTWSKLRNFEKSLQKCFGKNGEKPCSICLQSIDNFLRILGSSKLNFRGQYSNPPIFHQKYFNCFLNFLQIFLIVMCNTKREPLDWRKHVKSRKFQPIPWLQQIRYILHHFSIFSPLCIIIITIHHLVKDHIHCKLLHYFNFISTHFRVFCA